MSVIYIPPSKNVGESVHDINTNFEDLDKLKVDKVNGMGLSQENFTTAEKNKLSGLSDYDDTAVKNDISALKSGKADKSDVYTKKETDSKITGLSDRITTNKNDIAGLKTSKANKTDVYTKSETDNKITSKIAEIVADAPEEFDTLKEMSDWISSHEDSAAAMNTAIRNNSTLITALNNEIGVASKRIDGHDDDISGLQAQTKYMSEYKLDTAAFNSYKAGVREEFETVNDNITDLKSRKINGVLFDGSGDIKIGLDSCVVYDRAANWSASPWHKIAGCEVTKASNQRNLTLYAERMHHPKPGGSGILRAVIRSGSSAGVFHSAYLDWEYANGQINTDNFVLVYTSDTDSKKISAELWMKITAQYESWQFKVLSMGEATISDTSYWTLYDSSSGTENYSEGSGVITSSFMGIKNNADTAETAGFADYAGTVSAVQRSVYSLSETHDNPLNIIVPLLFTAYRLVICNITTSKDFYSCMLPMQYIKSRGASRFIVNNFLMFTYVDDNTIEIRTGLAQVNPTISRVELIAVY